MKPGPNDVKLAILITGDELHELKRFTIDMIETFGLDRRIEKRIPAGGLLDIADWTSNGLEGRTLSCDASLHDEADEET